LSQSDIPAPSLVRKVGLVTGITGQDGSYMAEHLLAHGYRVIGLTRDLDAARRCLPSHLPEAVGLQSWDPCDQESITSIVAEHRPHEIYNFAAYSTGTGMYDDPVLIGEVNGLAVARMLEAIRKIDPSIRFCQASSREIFGEALVSPQTELTPMNPRSPYGAAKLYADSMVRIYRGRYGLFAVSAILFNHESPRREFSFISRKITHAAARIKRGLDCELVLGNLDTLRDWGFAGDYVRAMWLILQQSTPDDYVIATGTAHSVRDLCQLAFSRVGLDYRDHVRTDPELYRPSEPLPLVGNPAKARSYLGWEPQLEFSELIGQMVDNDLALLRTG
jgi:GDPmannose 4,6-dehydratase